MQLHLQQSSAPHHEARPGSAAVLHQVTLEIGSGQQVAIIGPSGAGKTTLLHLLACALRPSHGQLLLAGQDPWQLGARALQRLRGQLFLAPQVPPLPPRQRVVTAVLAARLPHESLWASLTSLIYPHDIGRAERALAGFDLERKLFERVDHLSGGERQRVGLARALVAQAGLLLVDEPLSALDPNRAQQALTTLTGAAQASGATLVVTLHHVEMALAHFPRIIGLRAGQLMFDLPAAQVSQALLHTLYQQQTRPDATGAASAADATGDGAPGPDFAATASTQAATVLHCR
jgi:phosphonate transport system ATP-binding protein